jgi:AraC family transcriptional regulator
MHFQTTFDAHTPRLTTARANNVQQSTVGAKRRPSVALAGMAVAPVVGGLAPWQIKKVAEHIEANLCEKLHLDGLATLVRLSTSYFSAAFRRNFGTPPHVYIIGRRVELAKELMAEGKLQLSEIALECGFADQAHLSRSFRRATGMTPSDHRRGLNRLAVGSIAA